jgi:sialic acid synthase SpsE
MIKSLELNYNQFRELKNYSDELGIGFLSSGFDNESIDFLNTLGLDYFKIPSGEITNIFLLEKLASLRKPILLSTGMSKLSEIEHTINILRTSKNRNKIILFHCNSEYPTPFEDANLKAIKILKKTFGLDVGYSDHTVGIEASIAAVSMGAIFIEKHFTLDKSLDGPDHSMSLNPIELKELIASIRNIELALNMNGEIIQTKSELKNIKHVRKSLFFNKNLKKGHIIKKNDLISLRPGTGISPMNYYLYLGKKLKFNVFKNQILNEQCFE